MRITQIHLDYINAKRRPSWASRIARLGSTPSIHQVINAHAGPALGRDLCVANTLTLIRLRCRRGLSAMDAMTGLGRSAGSPRRGADVKKWRRRLSATDGASSPFSRLSSRAEPSAATPRNQP